ncbi:pantoate--beta-alanine ligase, partial [Mesorhizobium sp. M7A.T.Ca.TU.009.01.1.2]
MSQPVVVDSVAALRAQIRDWRRDGLRVAMVPTMG